MKRFAFALLILLAAWSAEAKDYTARNLGLWLDNTTNAARSHNDQQMRAFLTGQQPADSRYRTPVAANGDTLTWGGTLAITQPIEFPTVTGLGGGENQKIPRPLSFALRGDSVSTSIDCSGKLAVQVVDNWPLPPLAPYNHVQQRIEGVTITCPNGTGLDVYGGGKFFQTRDVTFVDCREPANFAVYDGGLLELHAHRCRRGFYMDAVHMNELRITAREIGDDERRRYGMAVDDNPPDFEGVGLIMRRSTGNDAYLYLEALKRSFDIDGMAESSLHCWFEHTGGKHSVHSWIGTLRNCQGNDWFGKTGDENGLPWDCDAVSWAMQRIHGQPSVVGTPFVSGDKFGPQIWGKFNKPVTIDKAGWVTVEAGAFGPGTSGYVALVYAGEQTQKYAAGDVFQVEFTIEPDAATLAHWRSVLDAGDGRVPLRLSFANDLGAFWAVSYFVHQPKQRVRLTRIAPADGQRVLPMVSLGLGYTEGPAERLRFRISDIELRKLPR